LEKIVREQLELTSGVSKNLEITDESRFMEDLGADSLDCVEILMEVEESFDLALTDEQVSNATTFGQVVAIIDAAKAAKKEKKQ
jgi:acyl carrier protein